MSVIFCFDTHHFMVVFIDNAQPKTFNQIFFFFVFRFRLNQNRAVKENEIKMHQFQQWIRISRAIRKLQIYAIIRLSWCFHVIPIGFLFHFVVLMSWAWPKTALDYVKFNFLDEVMILSRVSWPFKCLIGPRFNWMIYNLTNCEHSTFFMRTMCLDSGPVVMSKFNDNHTIA